MINGTLLVQIFHFWIGYFILKYLVLKPGFTFLQKQAQEEHKLHVDIAKLRDKVAAQELTKEKTFQRFCKRIEKKKPQLDEYSFAREDRALSPEITDALTEADSKKVIKSLKETIISQVTQSTIGEQ